MQASVLVLCNCLVIGAMIRIYKFPSIKQHQAAQSLPGCWVKVCLEAWLTAVICGLERAWNELGTSLELDISMGPTASKITPPTLMSTSKLGRNRIEQHTHHSLLREHRDV